MKSSKNRANLSTYLLLVRQYEINAIVWVLGKAEIFDKQQISCEHMESTMCWSAQPSRGKRDITWYLIGNQAMPLILACFLNRDIQNNLLIYLWLLLKTWACNISTAKHHSLSWQGPCPGKRDVKVRCVKQIISKQGSIKKI